MKTLTQVLCAAAAFGALGAAVAQPNENPTMNNETWSAEGPYDSRWYRQRAEDYRRYNYPGAGPGRDLRIGETLPRGYRHGSYAVDDWRGHGLFRPPSGYRWYQAGGDYVLVENATGRIAQSRIARR